MASCPVFSLEEIQHECNYDGDFRDSYFELTRW